MVTRARAYEVNAVRPKAPTIMWRAPVAEVMHNSCPNCPRDQFGLQTARPPTESQAEPLSSHPAQSRSL